MWNTQSGHHLAYRRAGNFRVVERHLMLDFIGLASFGNLTVSFSVGSSIGHISGSESSPHMTTRQDHDLRKAGFMRLRKMRPLEPWVRGALL